MKFGLIKTKPSIPFRPPHLPKMTTAKEYWLPWITNYYGSMQQLSMNQFSAFFNVKNKCLLYCQSYFMAVILASLVSCLQVHCCSMGLLGSCTLPVVLYCKEHSVVASLKLGWNTMVSESKFKLRNIQWKPIQLWAHITIKKYPLLLPFYHHMKPLLLYSNAFPVFP
jgi:hypothetical protein